MELEQVAATLRSYVSKSGMLEALAVVADDVVVRCDGRGKVFVERGEDGEPEPIDHRAAEPVPIGLDLKRLPPFAVDAETGEVSGPLGGLEHVALGVLRLSRAIGGFCVAIAFVPTTDDTPLAISARDGEGVVVVIGDEQFEMDEGWPPEGLAPPAV
ncbi:MAG TPA: hypothetical protein VFR97_08600 [Capillimicrobium sp.]|nr:hypothetical protein [Capillimicrobium sp.]